MSEILFSIPFLVSIPIFYYIIKCKKKDEYILVKNNYSQNYESHDIEEFKNRLSDNLIL